jgi:hypothetical protein
LFFPFSYRHAADSPTIFFVGALTGTEAYQPQSRAHHGSIEWDVVPLLERNYHCGFQVINPVLLYHYEPHPTYWPIGLLEKGLAGCKPGQTGALVTLTFISSSCVIMSSDVRSSLGVARLEYFQIMLRISQAPTSTLCPILNEIILAD